MNNLLKAGIVAGALAFASTAHAAITYSQPASVPTTDVVAEFWNDGGADTGTMSFRNPVDLPISGTNPDPQPDRTLGQTFTISAGANIYAITLQTNGGANFKNVTVGTPIIELGFFDETNNIQIGSVQSVNVGTWDPVSGFVTFTFDPVTLPVAGNYAFEFGFIDDALDTHDDNALNFAVLRTMSDAYAGGGQISKNNYEGGLPNVFMNGNTSNDLLFTVQGTAVPEPATFALLGGIAALGLVMYRRRR
jgi:hypothetical protein